MTLHSSNDAYLKAEANIFTEYQLSCNEIFMQVITVCIAAPILVIDYKSLTFQEGSN